MTPRELKFEEGGALYPAHPDSSRLLVGCRRTDYSASRISTAVEDCDAHVLNLNITSLGENFSGAEGNDILIVDLRVDHRSPAAISRSLERYGYSVLMTRGTDDDDPRDDSLRNRINELLRYIDT
ncbi:MAG: hypothetical protein K2L96_07840 [Muribaculaceae bacterium]|nr:hypothetical protein [Muribaculaceae bacterium]